jgi:hypothetical protein
VFVNRIGYRAPNEVYLVVDSVAGFCDDGDGHLSLLMSWLKKTLVTELCVLLYYCFFT